MDLVPSAALLCDHGNAVVSRHARLGVELWEALPSEMIPADLQITMPVTDLVEKLKDYCAQLPDENPALKPLNDVLLHLAIVSRIMDLSIVSSFKRLGAGSFATVFVSEGREGVVVKQVKDPKNVLDIQKEHEDLMLLYSNCGNAQHLFQLPRPFGFYDTYHSFALDADIPRTLDLGLPPHSMYVMQRIWPVSHSIMIRIQDLFFPEQYKNQLVKPFLARLYLGRETSRGGNRFFSAENYPLDASRIQLLGLPAKEIASGMGSMLSYINFQIGRDGRDIEFVLSGNPDNPLSKVPWYSCIDFNQMREHKNEAMCIVSSIVTNDPYYPKPVSVYWNDFIEAYKAGAAAVSTSAAELADTVVEGLLKHWSPE